MEARVLAVMRTTPGTIYTADVLAQRVGSVSPLSVVNVLRGLVATGFVEKVACKQWMVPSAPNTREGARMNQLGAEGFVASDGRRGRNGLTSVAAPNNRRTR
jgi:hypothetical protein